MTAYQSTGYIVQHSSLLRGTSLGGGLQSAVVDQRLLEKTHIDLLIFWEYLIEVTHEFHMLTSSLQNSSVQKTKVKYSASPQSARAHICSCLHTSIQCLVADRLGAVSLNSRKLLLEGHTKNDSGIFIPTAFNNLKCPFFHPERARLQHSPIKR